MLGWSRVSVRMWAHVISRCWISSSLISSFLFARNRTLANNDTGSVRVSSALIAAAPPCFSGTTAPLTVMFGPTDLTETCRDAVGDLARYLHLCYCYVCVKDLIHFAWQVSTSSSVVEGREVVYSSSPADSVQWDEPGEALETKEEVMNEQPLKPLTVRFVLEESSGYMEPMLRILAVMHTVISFFCIIGYYCLKVGYLIWLHR